ncbi:MAG: S8 family peptidase [Actinomycetota bacterium]
MGATGCATSTELASPAAPLPPAPPVEPIDDIEPAYPDDGLHRFIVRPTATGVDTTPVPDAAGSAGTTRDSEVDEALAPYLVDEDRLANVPQDSFLEIVGGELGYRDENGTFIALPLSYEPGASGLDAPSFGHPVIDALARHESVARVADIGDGSYAVETSDPAVFAEITDLTVTEDPPLGFANDPYQGYQWGLENNGDNLNGLSIGSVSQTLDADVDGVEALTMARGAGVVVAVVDSGVDFSHPDLAGQSWVNDDENCTNGVDDDANGFVDDCYGWDFNAEDNVPYASGHHAHGTHVAGIIAAIGGNGLGVTGLAPEVRIMDLAVTASGSMSSSSVARAVRYAVDNGADVINLSLGSSPGTPASAAQSMIDAVIYAEAAGVLVVSAAGNSGVNIDSATVYPASVDSSANLTVGASGPSDVKASFSNYGQTVDLLAPGELILSTMPGGSYSFMSGTSQAAPMTSAAAALVLGAEPTLTPDEVIARLSSTSDTVDALSGMAAGPYRLNAEAAVGNVAAPEPTVPPAPASGVDISGLAASTPDAVAAQIDLHGPDEAPDEPYRWEASIVALENGQILGIVDHAVAVDGVATATDDRGAVSLGDEQVTSASITTALPAGDYALVVEAVAQSDSSVRFGSAFASRFTLTATGAEVSPVTTTTAPPSGGSSGGSGGSGSGGGGATGGGGSAGGGTSPTTAPASGGGTGGGSTGGGSTGGGSAGGGTSPTTAPASGGGTGGGSTGGGSTGGGSTGGGSTGGGSTGGGSTGGGTSPTTAPASGGGTGGGGSTSPAPTTPNPVAPTTSVGPVPEGLEPINAENGDWSVTSVSPRTGPVNWYSVVSIAGTFPNEPNVWFGDAVGQVLVYTPTWMLVQTPLVADAGVIDMELRTSGGGTNLTIPAAFAFTSVETGAGSGGSGSGGSGGSTTTTAPATGGTVAPTTTAPTSSTTVVEGPRRSRAEATGDAVDIPRGLRGRPLTGLDGVTSLSPCSTDPCPATALV